MLLRARRRENILPLGSDREAKSDFQLIAGTNRDCSPPFNKGLPVKTCLPASTSGPSPCRPATTARRLGTQSSVTNSIVCRKYWMPRVTFNREARAQFLEFASLQRRVGPATSVDLNASGIRGWLPFPQEAVSPFEVVGRRDSQLRASWRSDGMAIVSGIWFSY